MTSNTAFCVTDLTFLPLRSVGKNHESEIRYHPFRMTPYLVQVRDPQGAEDQLCCVLLAERVHSGYEGNSRSQLLPRRLPGGPDASGRLAPSPASPPASARLHLPGDSASPGPPGSPIHATSRVS